MSRTIKSMAGRALVLVAMMALALPAWGSTWTFVHITDLHVGDPDSWCPANSDAGHRDDKAIMLGQLFLHISNLSPRPKFVVATGDLVQFGGSDQAWQYLKAALYGDKNNGWYIDPDKKIPIFFTPGNHDWRDCWGAPVNITGYEDYLGYKVDSVPPPLTPLGDGYHDWTYEYDGILLVGLESGHDGTDIHTPPQSTGLELAQHNALNSLPKDTHKILLMHHPAINTDEPNHYEGIIYNYLGGYVFSGPKLIEDAPSDKIGVVLTGHTHQSKIVSLYGKPLGDSYTFDPACDFSPVSVQTGAAKDGVYRVITVSGDTVTIGSSQTYQRPVPPPSGWAYLWMEGSNLVETKHDNYTYYFNNYGSFFYSNRRYGLTPSRDAVLVPQEFVVPYYGFDDRCYQGYGGTANQRCAGQFVPRKAWDEGFGGGSPGLPEFYPPTLLHTYAFGGAKADFPIPSPNPSAQAECQNNLSWLRYNSAYWWYVQYTCVDGLLTVDTVERPPL